MLTDARDEQRKAHYRAQIAAAHADEVVADAALHPQLAPLRSSYHAEHYEETKRVGLAVGFAGR